VPRDEARRAPRRRGGKTSTVVEGIRFSPSPLERIARELRRALGCGASVDEGRLVLQGDLVARVGGGPAGRARVDRRNRIDRSGCAPSAVLYRTRPGAGASRVSRRPCRRHPMRASQVCALATGGGSDGEVTVARHPVNHGADDRGSSPLAPRMCFLKLFSTYTSAFRTSRGVARMRAW